jgi:UDP-N-acetylmuramate--alanine ligase
VTSLGRTKTVHFVGIGGIGMSGIAELLLNMGYSVSGSDARRSEVTDRLARLGALIHIGHDAGQVGDADVVVVSSAIDPANAEVASARARRVPVIPRAEMLAELMRLHVGIAIAGAHGKTTTTSMVAFMLETAGLDPTAVIGGRLSAFGSNARLGRGKYMVAEADESDRSFLKLSPVVAVVTNIDYEHMEAYGSFDRIVDAFRTFADAVPFYGAVVACVDDAAVRAMLPSVKRRVVTYGFADDADVRGIEPTTDGHTARCDVRVRGRQARPALGPIALGVPGRHNLQNALASVAVGLELDVPFDKIARSLSAFRGVDRRYELRGSANGVTVVDDYGHHPTEIAAVVQAARAGRPGRLIVVFQPHRFTRTRDLMASFGPALAGADIVVLTDIYTAGEPAIQGITLDGLAAAVRPHVADLQVVPALDDIPDRVAGLARDGDLVITLGAGSISGTADRILLSIQAHRRSA